MCVNARDRQSKEIVELIVKFLLRRRRSCPGSSSGGGLYNQQNEEVPVVFNAKVIKIHLEDN